MLFASRDLPNYHVATGCCPIYRLPRRIRGRKTRGIEPTASGRLESGRSLDFPHTYTAVTSHGLRMLNR